MAIGAEAVQPYDGGAAGQRGFDNDAFGQVNHGDESPFVGRRQYRVKPNNIKMIATCWTRCWNSEGVDVKQNVALFLCVGCVLVLCGCGQKGDLYLPDKPPKAEQKKVPGAEPSSTTQPSP